MYLIAPGVPLLLMGCLLVAYADRFDRVAPLPMPVRWFGFVCVIVGFVAAATGISALS